MAGLDKGALDRWITTEPDWQVIRLVTMDNFNEVYPHDDLMKDELTCYWSGDDIGWQSIAFSTEAYFVPFYVLDEDCEITVEATRYEESQARQDDYERKLDAEIDATMREARGQ